MSLPPSPRRREIYAFRAAFGDLSALSRLVAKRIVLAQTVTEIARRLGFSQSEIELTARRHEGALLGMFLAEKAGPGIERVQAAVPVLNAGQRDRLVQSLRAAVAWMRPGEVRPPADVAEAWARAMVMIARAGLADAMGALYRHTGTPEAAVPDRAGISATREDVFRTLRHQSRAAVLTVLASKEPSPKAKAILTGFAAAAAFARTQGQRLVGGIRSCPFMRRSFGIASTTARSGTSASACRRTRAPLRPGATRRLAVPSIGPPARRSSR